MTTHKLHGPKDHADSWSSDSCQACVLSFCKVCRGGEADLPTDCPGRIMTTDEMARIALGVLDYRNGEWVLIV